MKRTLLRTAFVLAAGGPLARGEERALGVARTIGRNPVAVSRHLRRRAAAAGLIAAPVLVFGSVSLEPARSGDVRASLAVLAGDGERRAGSGSCGSWSRRPFRRCPSRDRRAASARSWAPDVSDCGPAGYVRSSTTTEVRPCTSAAASSP